MQSNTDIIQELFQLWIQTFDKQVSTTPPKIPMDETACNNIFRFYYHNISTSNHFCFLYRQLASSQEKKCYLKIKQALLETKWLSHWMPYLPKILGKSLSVSFYPWFYLNKTINMRWTKTYWYRTCNRTSTKITTSYIPIKQGAFVGSNLTHSWRGRDY